MASIAFILAINKYIHQSQHRWFRSVRIVGFRTRHRPVDIYSPARRTRLVGDCEYVYCCHRTSRAWWARRNGYFRSRSSWSCRDHCFPHRFVAIVLVTPTLFSSDVVPMSDDCQRHAFVRVYSSDIASLDPYRFGICIQPFDNILYSII